jgi:hypothetical protein
MIEDILSTKFEEVSSIGEKDLSWIGLTQEEIDEIVNSGVNPLMKRTHEEQENPGLREFYLMHDPNYLWFTAKFLFNVDLLPIQAAVLHTIWTHKFPIYVACRGFGKTFLLGLYAIMRATLYQDTSIVVVGAAFRQSKLIFEYAETVWNNAPILRSIFRSRKDGPRRDIDRCTLTLGQSKILAVPIGIQGAKIRGLRANIVISDEHNSQDPEIYETVVAGFGAVAASPIENVKFRAKREKLIKLDKWDDDADNSFINSRANQNIISGTCGYSFQHFAKYWERYKEIIQSKGDRKKIADILGDAALEKGFDYKDFAVIRIPMELTPPGFLDEATIARAKATMHTSAYEREYGAVYSSDSTGFFKRSLIEHCTVRKSVPIKIEDQEIYFDARITGDQKLKYVMGIDPASEQDNFSIVILELHTNHTRVVYCWTTNRKEFKMRLNKGTTLEHDYFRFCARKIRDLMRVFPCAGIGIDAQGGGRTIEEALQDPDKLQDGELPIYPVIDEKKEQDTDHKHGLHMLELIQFRDSLWTSTANYGLKKDMTDLVLLFPSINPILLGLALESDKEKEELFKEHHPDKYFVPYDTLEDCMLEIDEMKEELTTVELMTTQTTERWDTPETRSASGKKGRLRKDRYSALVIANAVARNIQRAIPPPAYQFVGGVVGHVEKIFGDKMYTGPEWWESPHNLGKVRPGVQ